MRLCRVMLLWGLSIQLQTEWTETDMRTKANAALTKAKSRNGEATTNRYSTEVSIQRTFDVLWTEDKKTTQPQIESIAHRQSSNNVTLQPVLENNYMVHDRNITPLQPVSRRNYMVQLNNTTTFQPVLLSNSNGQQVLLNTTTVHPLLRLNNPLETPSSNNTTVQPIPENTAVVPMPSVSNGLFRMITEPWKQKPNQASNLKCSFSQQAVSSSSGLASPESTVIITSRSENLNGNNAFVAEEFTCDESILQTPHLTTCRGRCGHLHDTSCSCDEYCLIYKTCCNDFEDRCPVDFQLSAEKYVKFMGVAIECLTPGYNVIAGCPQDSSQEMNDKCSKLQAAPVTLSDTGLHFRNTNCLKCHGLNESSSVYWILEMRFTVRSMRHVTSFDLRPYMEAAFYYWIPASSISFLTFCKPENVDQCPSGTSAYMKHRCSTDRGVVRVVLSDSYADISYANKYCAQCNTNTSAYYVCHYVLLPDLSTRHSGDFKMLMSWLSPDEVSIMTNNFIFAWKQLVCEIKTENCVVIKCRDGFVIVDGKCVSSHCLHSYIRFKLGDILDGNSGQLVVHNDIKSVFSDLSEKFRQYYIEHFVNVKYHSSDLTVDAAVYTATTKYTMWNISKLVRNRQVRSLYSFIPTQLNGILSKRGYYGNMTVCAFSLNQQCEKNTENTRKCTLTTHVSFPKLSSMTTVTKANMSVVLLSFIILMY